MKVQLSLAIGLQEMLETTHSQVDNLQEPPSAPTAELSDQNGQDSDCDSLQRTFSVRAEKSKHKQETGLKGNPTYSRNLEPSGRILEVRAVEHFKGTLRS